MVSNPRPDQSGQSPAGRSRYRAVLTAVALLAAVVAPQANAASPPTKTVTCGEVITQSAPVCATPAVVQSSLPSTPTGLTATPNDSSVSLSWMPNPAADAVLHYSVYRVGQAFAGAWATVTGTSFTNASEVVNGTQYCYQITATNAAGESAKTSPVCATPAPPTTAGPSTPVGFTATAGNGSVVLSWHANPAADAVTFYNVYRTDQQFSGPWASLAGTTHTDAVDLVNGTLYCYEVTANNAAGESAKTAPVCATPTAPPSPAHATTHAAESAAGPAGPNDYGAAGGHVDADDGDVRVHRQPARRGIHVQPGRCRFQRLQQPSALRPSGRRQAYVPGPGRRLVRSSERQRHLQLDGRWGREGGEHQAGYHLGQHSRLGFGRGDRPVLQRAQRDQADGVPGVALREGAIRAVPMRRLVEAGAVRVRGLRRGRRPEPGHRAFQVRLHPHQAQHADGRQEAGRAHILTWMDRASGYGEDGYRKLSRCYRRG